MTDIIEIDGEIGDSFWSWNPITLDYVKQHITEDSDTILLRINSPGGICSVGFAIHDHLVQLSQSSNKKIEAEINGLCASIATIIALAADEVHMSENSDFMIHLPWGAVMGTADDMESYIKSLRNYENNAAKVYADYTGMTENKAWQLMKDETWMTAKEAKDLGFVNKIIKSNKKKAKQFSVKAIAAVKPFSEDEKYKFAACASANIINSNSINIMSDKKETINLIEQFKNFLLGKGNQENIPAALAITLHDGTHVDVATEGQEPEEGDVVTREGAVVENEVLLTHQGDEITTDGEGKITKIDKYEEVQNRKKNMDFEAKLKEQETTFNKLLEEKVNAINAQAEAQQKEYTAKMQEFENKLSAKDEVIESLKSTLAEQNQKHEEFRTGATNKLDALTERLKLSSSDFKPENEDQNFSTISDEGVERNASLTELKKMKEERLQKKNS